MLPSKSGTGSEGGAKDYEVGISVKVVEQDQNGTERKGWKGLLLVNRDIGMSVYKKESSEK